MFLLEFEYDSIKGFIRDFGNAACFKGDSFYAFSASFSKNIVSIPHECQQISGSSWNPAQL